LVSAGAACSPEEGAPPASADEELEADFREFLQEYRRRMEARDRAYLKTIHPELPEDYYDLFFDATEDMSAHTRDRPSDRSVECDRFQICKITYPQPENHWASQRFIRQEGEWFWLE
jgi:hypothetical protein